MSLQAQGAVLIHTRESWVCWAFLDLLSFYCQCGQAKKGKTLISPGVSVICAFQLPITWMANSIYSLKYSKAKQIVSASGNPGSNSLPCIALLEQLIQPKETDLDLECSSWLGVLINSDTTTALLEENNQVNQRKGVLSESQGSCWQVHTFEKPGFAGWALWSRCNPFKERKAWPVC